MVFNIDGIIVDFQEISSALHVNIAMFTLQKHTYISKLVARASLSLQGYWW